MDEGRLRKHVHASRPCRLHWESKMSGVTTNSNLEQKGEGENTGWVEHNDGFMESAGVDTPYLPADNEVPSKRSRIDHDGPLRRKEEPRYGEQYPGSAGHAYRRGQTTFERWLNSGMGAWDPFQNEEEWDLVKWLARNVGQTALDNFLKLELVSDSQQIQARVASNERQNLGNSLFIISTHS